MLGESERKSEKRERERESKSEKRGRVEKSEKKAFSGFWKK